MSHPTHLAASINIACNSIIVPATLMNPDGILQGRSVNARLCLDGWIARLLRGRDVINH